MKALKYLKAVTLFSFRFSLTAATMHQAARIAAGLQAFATLKTKRKKELGTGLRKYSLFRWLGINLPMECVKVVRAKTPLIGSAKPR